MEYDLQTSKPLTNKQKRQQKQTLKEHKALRGSMNDQFKEAMESGKPLEIDCAKIVKGSDYKLPPFVKGYINVDGKNVAQSLHTNTIDCNPTLAQAHAIWDPWYLDFELPDKLSLFVKIVIKAKAVA